MNTAPASRRVLVALLAGLLVVGAARAENEQATPAPIPETTVVEGKIAGDLVGRWLTVNSPKLPNGRLMHVGRLWEIRQGPAHLELVLHRRALPPALTQRLQQASAASQTWAPAPADLEEIQRLWDDLPPDDANYARIEHKLIGADAFADELKADPMVQGSDFAILVQETFGGSQPLRSTYSVYGVRQADQAGIGGTSVTTSIAVALIPIPITYKGEFRSYRLAAGSRSFVQRLMDVFSGCGR